LNERKEALVIESDLNRLVLRLEVEHWRNSAERLDRTLTTARQVSRWLIPIASVIGLVTSKRKDGSKAGWLNRILHLVPALMQFRATAKPEK